jgi:hypothetical protein
MSFFFSLKKKTSHYDKQQCNVRDVSKTTKNCLFILKTFYTISLYFSSLFKSFLFFFSFVKLALGLNNVCKVRCTNKQKRKRPLFVSTKNHPKNKLLSAILYTLFFSLFDSLYVLSRFLEQIKL